MVTLTNVGTTYDAIVASQGLGLAWINFTGVVSVEALIKVQKIGTGTHTYQLFNETDGTEIGVITDSAAAGTPKNLTGGPWAVNLTGWKLIRFRARSTVSTDDPIWLGRTIRLT